MSTALTVVAFGTDDDGTHFVRLEGPAAAVEAVAHAGLFGKTVDLVGALIARIETATLRAELAIAVGAAEQKDALIAQLRAELEQAKALAMDVAKQGGE